MFSKPHPLVSALSRALVPDAERAALEHAGFDDAGHGYDQFGLSPQWVAMGSGLVRPLYERYFRVTSEGIENIPASGPALLIANHSGVIPIDAAMLWADVVRKTRPVRVPRMVMDYFVPLLPFVGVFFARVGGVGGGRGNVEELLRAGELVTIFPEGTTGIGKTYRRRYQLQAWRPGHVELAIRHRAPVIPAAIVGPEEQFMQLGKIRAGADRLGVPFIPITLSPLPLPVHYFVKYGAPIFLHETHPDADDPGALELAGLETRARVEDLIAETLAQRKGVFS